MRYFRFFRWLVFLAAFATDLIVFYYSDPFSAQSFMTAGGAALGMYLLIAVSFSWVRFRGRIRRALNKGEKVVYEVGYHWVRLALDVWSDKRSRLMIGVPYLLATGATAYYLLWGMYALDAVALGALWWLWPVYDTLSNNGVLMGLYIPLLVAIPRTIYHVLEWATYRHAITDERIMIHSGILHHRMQSISLSRIVDTEVFTTFMSWILGYGTLTLRLTAGGEEGHVLKYLPHAREFDKLLREIRRSDTRSSGHTDSM